MWYPEKELYLQNGVGNAKPSPTDYEQEFARLASERGIDQSRIDAARTRDTDGRLAGYLGGTGDVTVEEADSSRLGRKERSRLIQKEATQRLREQLPRTTRRGMAKGPQRLLNGAPVAQVYKPELKVSSTYTKAGLATPTVMELDVGQKTAEVFHEAIQKAKGRNSSGAAVYVYPVEEYENMRLFMTEDGSAGFALNGGDIVSLFKDPQTDLPGVAQHLVALAVAEGGRKLDAFDTVLPDIYSLQGFRVISRLKWDESQAPDGWNKKDFANFNEGEPDVVFMVYDKEYKGAYVGQAEGQLVEDYGVAVSLQDKAVLDLWERNKPDQKLKYRIEDEPLPGEAADPTSPFSVVTKLQATAEAQTNLAPGWVPGEIIKDMWATARRKGFAPAYMSIVGRRNLIDSMPGSEALEGYVKEVNRMQGERNEMIDKTEGTVDRWMKYTTNNKRQAGRLSDLMHATTLAGVDPSKKYAPLKNPKRMNDVDKRADALRREKYVVLKKFYEENLDEEGRAIFNTVRDEYIEHRKVVDKALETRILMAEANQMVRSGEFEGTVEEAFALIESADTIPKNLRSKRAGIDMLRKKMETGYVAGPYFPLMRYGDLWAAAKDGNGEVVSYSRFENQRERSAWIKEMTEGGFIVTKGQKGGDAESTLNNVDPGFVAQVQELVEDQGTRDAIWQAYMASLPEMSIRKRMMGRKGRLGFAANALRAYASTMFHGAHQVARRGVPHGACRALVGGQGRAQVGAGEQLEPLVIARP